MQWWVHMVIGVHATSFFCGSHLAWYSSRIHFSLPACNPEPEPNPSFLSPLWCMVSRRGFRLRLSLTRLEAAQVRERSSKEGKKSVAWGLASSPVSLPQPLDSYVPEMIKP